ncbi:MAG: hypothetical protein Q7S65_00885, partial [Nanoarchaeota archaeon]|nr:hypothetical protein [Nanoarchaeota archaeon]
LQKQDIFNRKFKNQYVQWTGIVSSVSDSYGLKMQVKHCPSTFVSDIIITMNEYERDVLLTLKEGDKVTYRAELVRLGDILGLSGEDGIIVLSGS